MAELNDRVPPQNLEAEASVLGSILIDRDAIVKALDYLQPESFYREANRRIYAACVNLFERGEAIDTITLSEQLRKEGILDQVGGISYLTTLANTVPTAANCEHYVKIVHEKALLRKLLRASTEIAASIYDSSEDVEVLLDRAEQAVFNISRGMKTDGAALLKSILVEAVENIERAWTNKGHLSGIPSGFRDLDELTSGFHPSELIILAARPSSGKTTLSLNMASHVAVDQNIPTAIFSLEMSKEQLAQRLLCSRAGVDAHRMRTGYLTDEDWNRISYALGPLSDAPLLIDDTPNISIMELRAKARRLQAEHNIQFIVIDYLQLMHTKGRAENRQQEVSEISRSLKALARELKVPILALSQLSRAVEQRQDRRPMLSDLRESGAIEQDADVVSFIYFNPEAENQNVADIIIAKQRNGPVGTVQLLFMKDIGRFVNIEKRSLQPPG